MDRSILMKKLAHYGILDTEYNWFKSYITGRKQAINIHGHTYDFLDIDVGVAQGSIIGPLLFLIYINDLGHFPKLIKLLFADNTTLLHTDKNFSRLCNDVNMELNVVSDWF